MLSPLDALFALVHLEGASIREANPMMNLVLRKGIGTILLVKLVLKILGGVVPNGSPQLPNLLRRPLHDRL